MERNPLWDKYDAAAIRIKKGNSSDNGGKDAEIAYGKAYRDLISAGEISMPLKRKYRGL